MVIFEESRQHERAARKCPSDDNAGAFFHGSQAIELAVKSLLDELGIEYEKGYRLKKEYFEEAFEKIRPKFEDGKVIDWNIDRVKETLTKASAWANILQSIRSYIEDPPLDMPTAKVFDYSFRKVREAVLDRHFGVEALITQLESITEEWKT